MTDAQNVVLDVVPANNDDPPGSPVEGQDGGKRHRKGRKGRKGSGKKSQKKSRKGKKGSGKKRSAKKGSKKRGPSKWIAHVKAYCKQHNMTFPEALKDPNCGKAFRR